MGVITTDLTIAFTKELKILYVEDDKELQEQTKEFFEVLFKSVRVASDGVEALQIYEKEPFDIVISDMKMPKMDGIELTKKIRKIDKDQCIIIISAYHESSYLLEFLNLNIRQFIQKPIQIENMLETLYYASKAIVNAKMIEEYREELERANEELTKKNNELQTLVRILDAKLLQISKSATESPVEIDNSKAEISDEDLSELQNIEIDIDGVTVLMALSHNLTPHNIKLLGDMFLHYAQTISHNAIYDELNIKIEELGNALQENPDNFVERVDDVTTLLESFVYVLRMWRGKITQKEFSKAFELHTSMINDINTILFIINATENEIETDMEFF